jgi:hypothetical protein
MRLIIRESVGPRCIVKEDGQRVYDAIYPVLKRGEAVTLDFAGVTQFASPFFNFAIGQLLRDIDVEGVKRLLQIENLLPDGRRVVDRVIENASKYHTDVDYRKIVDAILQQQAKESE